MPDDLDAELQAAANKELDRHLNDIYFESSGSIDRDCLFCQRLAATGRFAKFDTVDEHGWPVEDADANE